MIQILFAFLAGILTVAAPCILPMLPILLGASVGHQNKQRPLFIVAGFIVSFAAASLILSVIVTHLGLSQDLVRNIGVVVLIIFSIFLIWPKPFELLTAKMSGTINKAGQMGQGQGNWGALVLGLVLGVVWTPCAGPILGAILTLIATQGSTAKAVILIIAYAIGAGVPMLIIAYGSQWITTKVRAIAQYSVRLQQAFGVLILLLALTMYFQYGRFLEIENNLTAFFPQSTLEQQLVGQNNSNQTSSPMEQIEFSDYGPAPEFTGITDWLNSPPLTMAQLKGKVVLIDFWTYSCINCIRTLPYVTNWYNTYNKDGLVVVGVHTPEFSFEKVTSNVQDAVNTFGIKYPVAQDNNYGTWTAYNNQYWPAEYLINQKGEIVYEHFGEGNYDHTENAIRQLLGLSDDPNAKTSTLGNIASPEMYFEPSRLQNLDASQQPSAQPQNYTAPASVSLNSFALGGQWQFDQDHAQLTQGPGKILLHFSSGKVYMVAASPDKPVTLKIMVDGQPQPDVTVEASQLYTLFNSNSYQDHTIEIDISDAGFQAFTFTFG